jgi:hypothetical protein
MARRVWGILMVAALAWVPRADAAVISVVPDVTVLQNGSTFAVDIVVSGLLDSEALGTVAMQLEFNPSTLQGVSYVVDPENKMGVVDCEAATPGACDFSFGFESDLDPTTNGSPLDLFFLSDPALDFAALRALQQDGFILATVTFQAIDTGLSLLRVVSPFLGDATGTQEVPVEDVQNGGARVVPEPASASLLALGLGALALARRRRAA